MQQPRSGSKPVLALDCDGVIYALDRYVLDRLVNPQLGTNFTPADITDWHWSTLPPEAAKIFHYALQQPETWADGEAFPGVAEDVQELAEHFTIAIITAMPGRFFMERADWLRNHGIPGTLITTPSKVRQAQEIHAVAAVEDFATNANAYGKANIPCWLVARPYNQFVATGLNVQRGTWTEGKEWLLRLASALERQGQRAAVAA